MLILETTLYTNQKEKDELLSKPDQVMNALIVNYFGFLGLFKLGSRRKTLKDYPTNELSVRVNSIIDDNLDPSVVVKLAFDSGMLRNDVVNQMTRLLAAIKQRKIKTGKDLDETKIRELASLINVDTHRPSPVVLQIFKNFRNGDISLGQFTRDLYGETKKKNMKKVSAWFRQIVRDGQFLNAFAKLPSSISTSQPIAATSDSLDKDPVQNRENEKKLNDKILSDIIFRGDFTELGNITQVTDGDIEFAEKWVESNFLAKPFDIASVLNSGTESDLFKELSRISDKLADRVAIGLSALRISHWLSNMASKPEVLSAEVNRIPNFSKKMFDINFALSRTGSDIYRLTSRKNLDSKEMIKFKFWSDFESMLARDPDLPVDVFKTLDQNSLMDPLRVSQGLLDRRSLFLLGAVRKPWSEVFVSRDFREVVKNTFGPALISADKLPDNSFEIILDSKQVQEDEKLKNLLSILDVYPALKSMINVFDPSSMTGGDINTTTQFISTIRNIVNEKKYGYTIREFSKATEGLDLSKVSVTELGKFIADQEKSGLNFAAFLLNSIDGATTNFEIIDLFTRAIQEIIPQGVISLEKLLPYYYYKGEFSRKITPMIDEFVKKNFDELLKEESWAGSLLYVHTYNMGSNGRKTDFYNKWASKLMQALKEYKVPNQRNLDVFYLNLLDKKNNGTFPDSIWIDSFKTYTEVMQRVNRLETDGRDFSKEFVNMELSPRLKIEIIESIQRAPRGGYFISPQNGAVSLREGIHYGLLPEELTTEKALEVFVERLKAMESMNSPSGFGLHPRVFKYNKILEKTYNKFVRERSSDAGFKTSNPFEVIASAFHDPESKVDPKKVLEEIDFSETINETRGQLSRISSLTGKLITLLEANPDVITEKGLKNLLNSVSNIRFKLKGENKSAMDELRDTVISHFMKVIDSDPNQGDRLFDQLNEEGQREVSKRVKEVSFFKKSLDVIYHDECPIKPRMDIELLDMGNILKKNRVKVGSTRIKKNEKLSEFKNRLDEKVPIEPLHVNEIPISDEELQRKSAEYDALNNGRHGDIGVRLLREFDVNLPIQEKGQKEWEAENPKSEVHERQFHGCGSIAASFILRYGYAVFKEGDSKAVKTAGKMLGDGIYTSNVITKAIQYATDAGMKPAESGIGHKGYLFLQRAVLGTRGIDYEFAGGEGDRIRSPEWAFFHPNKQLRIYKAYETQIIHKSEMQKLKDKFSMNEDKPLKILSFKDFLTEAQLLGENGMKRANYIFKDGYIPVSTERTVFFNDLKDEFFNDNITMEYTPYGPMISLSYFGDEDEVFFVDYISQIMRSEKDLNKFLRILRATRNGGNLPVN